MNTNQPAPVAIPVSVLQTARQRFQAGPENVSQIRQLLESAIFQPAADTAMLEYQRRVSHTAAMDGNGAACGYYRMLGAMEFLQELIALGKLDKQPEIMNLTRPLNHRA